MSFYNTIKDDINIILKQDLLKKNYKKEIYDMFQVSDPPKDKFGDVSTNVALSLSKFLKTNPENFADILIKELKKIDYIEDIKVEGHGFINLLLKKDFWINELKQVLLKEDKYGESNIGKSKKVIIEFVSANPTGPLHIGHCRGAVYGDVLCNIMKKLGYKVYKEFYINNTGSQIDKLTNSVIYRYNELFNKNKKKIDDNLYPGEYLIALAKDLKKNYGSKLLENNKKNIIIIRNFSLKWFIDFIKEDLNLLGVKFDYYYSEEDLLKKNKVSLCIDILKKNKLIYQGIPEKPKSGDLDEWEPRKQSLFKSSNFGDDVDRALQKSNGDYTYFAKDIAYHFDKYKRGFNFMINVWGADHGGYIKRLTSAVKAITKDKANLVIKICQLVKIIDNKNIDIILSLSNGSLGRAMEIINTKNYFDIYHKVNKFIQNIETIENSDVEKLFSLYNSNEISVENFLLIIQFHITKVIKILTVKNNQNYLIHCYLSLFFKINEIISSFKSFKLDQNQLLNIIKSILLNHSKNYN